MLNQLDIEDILFLDIETVSQQRNFSDLDADFQSLWEAKSKFIREREELSVEDSYERAGIYAEFGKIVCISVGYFRQVAGHRKFRVTSFYGDDETALLQEFSDLLESHFSEPQHLLCGHNAKEFDFPYMCRRMLINGIKIPRTLNVAGKKPWEVRHLDTMELWKFGDYKHYTSIKLLTKVFGIPTPKDDIDGSQVGKTYWEEKDLDRIEQYCKKDVVAVAQLMLRYMGKEILEAGDVVEV
jgi:3'-5' exonuclease